MIFDDGDAAPLAIQKSPILKKFLVWLNHQPETRKVSCRDLNEALFWIARMSATLGSEQDEALLEVFAMRRSAELN